jgi:phosphoenolpyruvate carboxylase
MLVWMKPILHIVQLDHSSSLFCAELTFFHSSHSLALCYVQTFNGQHMEESVQRLLQAGKTPEEVYKSLCEQRVELVFTAHPTQAMRGSVRKKYDNLHKNINRLLRDMPESDKNEVLDDMYANIQAAWYASDLTNGDRPIHPIYSIALHCRLVMRVSWLKRWVILELRRYPNNDIQETLFTTIY